MTLPPPPHRDRRRRLVWALGPTLAAGLLLARPGVAAEGVWLPAEEAEAAWAEALTLAGLTRTSAQGGDIEITARGPAWLLTVRDQQGALHQVEVHPPQGTDERLDLLYLALSLREPVVERLREAAPPPPEPEPTPPAPPPSPAPRRPAPPAPPTPRPIQPPPTPIPAPAPFPTPTVPGAAPLAAPETPVPDKAAAAPVPLEEHAAPAPTEPPTIPTPPEEPAADTAPSDTALVPSVTPDAPLGPWLQVRGSLGWWPAQPWMPAGLLSAGVDLGSRLGVGMGLGVSGEVDLGQGRTYRDLTVSLPLESRLWHLRPRLAPTLAVRTFRMPSRDFAQIELFPGLDLGLAWPWRPTPPLDLALEFTWHTDLAPYLVDGETHRAQSVAVGLALRLHRAR